MSLATGCAQAPARDAAAMTNPPPQWTSGNEAKQPIPAQWLSAFADPALAVLVQDALNQNYDLKATAARVDAAWELARIEGASR